MGTTTRARKSDIPSLPFADRTLANLTQVFKLLSDESRLRILLTLSREGETHVTALCDMLGQSQPAVSHHLTLMRMAGLVGYRREGKFNFYRMDALLLGDLLERLFADAGRSSTISLGEFSLTFSRNTGRRR
jgi:ArsR family transcriptional regulator